MIQYHWDPFELLQQPKGRCFGVMKLNSPFYNSHDLELFTELWKHASVRCGADGGGNVLYSCVPSSHHPPTLPTFISGDFDSLREDIMNFYQDRGVELIATPDQNETDFTKCLKLLLGKAEVANLKLESVLAHIGASSRRLDHTLSNINTLLHHASYHKPASSFLNTSNKYSVIPSTKNLPSPPVNSSPYNNHVFSPASPSPSTHHTSFEYPNPHRHHPTLFLVMGDSITFILPPGTHRIESKSSLKGKWCSLVPIAAPTITTTQGLVYNMDHQLMSFGGLISTSNAFQPSSDHVLVENDQPLLFSMSVKFH